MLTNPGRLVSSIAKNEFGENSYGRNPLIFGLLERMRLDEHIGSGKNRMRDSMKEDGLTSPKSIFDGMFTVIS
jgi:predicted HTH transcriptional regulator